MLSRGQEPGRAILQGGHDRGRAGRDQQVGRVGLHALAGLLELAPIVGRWSRPWAGRRRRPAGFIAPPTPGESASCKSHTLLPRSIARWGQGGINLPTQEHGRRVFAAAGRADRYGHPGNAAGPRISAGLGEVVKYGVILDAPLFEHSKPTSTGWAVAIPVVDWRDRPLLPAEGRRGPAR